MAPAIHGGELRLATGKLVSKYMTALPSEEKIRAFLADDRDRTVLRVMEERAAYGERSGHAQ